MEFKVIKKLTSPELPHLTSFGRRLKNRQGLHGRNRGTDAGFTAIEIIMTIAITGIVVGLFSQILISSISIYTDRNERKNAHIDIRRAASKITVALRELRQWDTPPSATSILFAKISRSLSGNGQIYYHELRVGFELIDDQLCYRRDEGGNWANQYPLILSGVIPDLSRFTTVTAGGITRVTVELSLDVMGKPMRIRSTAFPRNQGG